MSRVPKTVVVLLMMAGPVVHVEAGLGAFLAHGVKAAAAKAGSIFGKTSKLAGGAARKAASKSTGKVAGKLTSGLTSKAGVAAGKTAMSASQTVMNRLGVAGMTAMAKLPPSHAKRFTELSGVLARSPHKTEWLSLISRHGTKCIDWLWRNKGGIAVTAGSGAVLLAPDAFLGTVGNVAVASVDSAGKYVVKPVIDNAGEHLAKPIIDSTVSGVRGVLHGHALWNVLFIAVFIFAAGKLYALRRQ